MHVKIGGGPQGIQVNIATSNSSWSPTVKMKLQLERVALKYGDRYALQDLTAVVEGRIVGLLGANASGKTSLLQILAGVVAPTEGCVLIDGAAITRGRRPGISFLPQETGAFPFWQRPGETLSGTFLLKGVIGIDPRKYLAALGLEEEDRSAMEFSGGMKQKLRIAQALAHAPRLLLLDEPTTGLDVRERFRVLRLIEHLRERVSVIFSTHQPEDVAAVCDEVLILHRGTAVVAGSPTKIATMADGRVFEVSLPIDKLPFDPDYEVVQAERNGETIRMRLVGTAPPDARSVSPRLQDAYVFLTHWLSG